MSSNPITIPFAFEESLIKPSNETVVDARKFIDEGKIIVLKNVFTADEILEIRSKIVDWGRKTSVFPHGESPSKYPTLNYHRIDDGSIPSVCPHIFHQYAFNTIPELENNLRLSLDSLSRKLLLIQNAFADTNFGISLDGLRLKILQYPQGGGFLQEHSHPRDPQRIGLILSMSRCGRDFNEGAAVFKVDGQIIDTVKYHDIGDVVIFRYDLPHAVSKVDSQKTDINWSLDTGKWSVVLEFRDTHGLSHKKKN